MNYPILYSFRRCPYAMRARIALIYSGVKFSLREVDLKNKPKQLIEISPKGTVPVLQLSDSKILEESLDIIDYSLDKNDPNNLALLGQQDLLQEANRLIENNDIDFVRVLRKYKYFERHPEHSQEYYRKEAEEKYLKDYEARLTNGPFLLGKKSKADIAIFPFIRQFAFADKEWFFNSNYKKLINWISYWEESEDFNNLVMKKYKPWNEQFKNPLIN